MYNALAKFSYRNLRRSSKKLRDRGLLKLLPQVGVDSPRYYRFETYNMLMVLAKNLDVLDELHSRQAFEIQSYIFEDVCDDMLPSSQIYRELDEYMQKLMSLPIDPILTIADDVFVPQSSVEKDPSAHSLDVQSVNEFCDAWNVRPFDTEHFKSYKHSHWVASEITTGSELTRSALSKYRHLMKDLRSIGVIPVATNIVTYRDRIYATMLVPLAFCSDFEPHSGMEITYNSSVHGATLVSPNKDNEWRQQQMTFSDQDTGYTYKIDDFVDDVRKSRDERVAAYKDFLKRPIKLNAYKWQVGGSLNADINPWDDYFGNNTRINNRISYFNLLRGKLCVKFVVSGTGFHYGRVLVSYMPLHRFDQMSGFSELIETNLVQQSQLPHIFLNPTTQQGGMMCLPYFYHEDYSAITARDWLELGNLQVRSLGTLKHANGGTDDVSVTVFAWMEDVEVSIPTSVDAANLQPQSGFEIQSGEEINEANMNGVVSGPASKLSSITSMLSDVPVIGPYASATSKIAGGLAMAAKAIGMSRPPITKSAEPFKPEALSSLALTTVPDRSAKLTVDDKQELSIDPRISGIGGDDPMDILSIAKKESFYTSFIWPKSANIGSQLFEVRVQPTIWDESTAGVIHLTALGYASMPFTYWTGTLKFRFQVQASAYHKGRLRVAYDPNWLDANAASNGDDMISNYTQIIDLANTTDFTISVTQGQTTSLVGHFYPGENVVSECFHGHDGITPPTPYIAKEKFVTNGVLGITVLNELTTPSSVVNNDVRVNCFVSAGDDFQVFDPNDYIKNFAVINLGFDAQSGFEPQSGEMKADKIDDNEIDMPLQSATKALGGSIVSPKLNEIYTGECIKSLRSLAKRFSLYHVAPLENVGPSPNSVVRWQAVYPSFPPYRGPTFGGTPVSDFIDYQTVNMTWLHYITLGFQGNRGSIRWKIVPIGRSNSDIILSADRSTTRVKNPFIRGLSTTIQPDTYDAYARYLMTHEVAGAGNAEPVSHLSGGTVSHPTVNATIEVESPYIHNFRFRPGKRGTLATRDNTRYGYDNTIRVQALTWFQSSTAYDNSLLFYIAGGEDFTTYFFTGCPPLQYQPTFPAA